MDDPLNVIAIFVAVTSLVIAVFGYRIADRAARNDVLAQVREWGGEVIELLSEAAGLCTLDPARSRDDVFFTRSSLLCRLSASVDKGRLFFPNAYTSYGGTKRKAFRGIRPEILDVVLLAHELAKSIDYEDGTDRELRRLAFTLLKAEFVSVVQYATSFDAPVTVKEYENFLKKISVDPIPEQIRILAQALNIGFQIRFVSTLELDPKHPGKTKLIGTGASSDN